MKRAFLLAPCFGALLLVPIAFAAEIQLSREKRAAGTSEYEDTRLRQGRVEWEVDAEESTRPEIALVERLELAGVWEKPAGDGPTWFTFRPSENGEYEVSLYTSGCLGEWSLERKARFEAGVVTFAYPVTHYPRVDYQRIYAVDIGGEVHLVPSADVEEFIFYRDGRDEDPVRNLEWFSRYLFRRTASALAR